MRYASFEINGQASYGVVDGAGQYRRVPADFQARFADLKAVIAADALKALAASSSAMFSAAKPGWAVSIFAYSL